MHCYQNNRVAGKKKSIQTGWMMFLLSQVLCVVSNSILSIISAVGNPEEVPPRAFAFAALIAKTAAFINPIIFFFCEENIWNPPFTATRCVVVLFGCLIFCGLIKPLCFIIVAYIT